MCLNLSSQARSKLRLHFEGDQSEHNLSPSAGLKQKLLEIKESNVSVEHELTGLDSVAESSSGAQEPLLSIGSVESTVSSDDLSIFDGAMKEIFKLMARDSFLRFCATKEFQAFWKQHYDQFESMRDKVIPP
jgi:hypothetical protein